MPNSGELAESRSIKLLVIGRKNGLFDSLPYREMPDFPYDDCLPWSDKVPTAVSQPAKGENKPEK